MKGCSVISKPLKGKNYPLLLTLQDAELQGLLRSISALRQKVI